MQNTKHTQKGLLGLLALAAVLLVILAVVPSQAYAKSYSMPNVDIAAEVTTDGDLNIVEQRTFDFDGSFETVYWNFGALPPGGSLQVNAASIQPVNSAGEPSGEAMPLPEEAFNIGWRDEGGPSRPAFSVDSPRNTVWIFNGFSDQRYIVTLDTTVIGGVQAYSDVGELNWKYVTEGWAESSDNVSLRVTLPLPEGTTVTPGDNVRAWGHGPLDGTVNINPDGSVIYEVPHVNSGQYAEARIAFPTEWLTSVSNDQPNASPNENRLDTILREEQGWADDANRNRILALVFIIGFAVISVLLLVWAIRMYFKHGKEYKPDFTDQYWRDVPSPQDHPAVIGRLWRWNKESPDDFTATLMYLSHKGAILINQGSYAKPGVFGNKQVDDYYLTRVPSVEATLTDPIDRRTMSFLFDTIAEGEDSLWFGSIKKYGEDHAEEFIDGMKSWQGVVTGETNKRDFFESKGLSLQVAMVVIAILFGAVGLGIGFFQENFIPLFFAIPVAIVLVVIANIMPRRSREGNNIDAKSKALRNWLKDFSALDERPPTDVKVWGEFMVYAFIFGIAKQVIKELQMKVPELFQGDDSMMGTSYVPWWFWYSAMHGPSGSVMPSAGDLLQTSVSNTMQTAQAAISGASGDFSSGGGFGGGFSGGGGGGFGGGGGGGAR